MKLVSYQKGHHDRLAVLEGESLYDFNMLDAALPVNMSTFLNGWDQYFLIAQEVTERLKTNSENYKGHPVSAAKILSPVPHPTSCRDGYAFRQHVATARRNRHVAMIPEFDQFPIFYFTNHNAVSGPGDFTCMPDHFKKLDFELEVAAVICREGRNIRAAEADQYIGGLMIMNDFSARTLQMEEMRLNLGPAKGKDFGTTFGPYLLTADELEKHIAPTPDNHTGNMYNLAMKAFVNSKQVSDGNMKDMNWTFAEIVERVSYGVQIHPGDVIGSGTVGTGCFLEINGTNRLQNPDAVDQWLQEGDEIELQIEALGSLKNKLIKDPDNFSILGLKKKV